MDLPVFRYHPDPIASGSIVASDAQRACCSARRGFIYTGARAPQQRTSLFDDLVGNDEQRSSTFSTLAALKLTRRCSKNRRHDFLDAESA